MCEDNYSFNLLKWMESGVGLLDLRGTNTYQQRHIKGSTSISIDQLPSRINDLPPRGHTLALLGDANALARAQELTSLYTIQHKFCINGDSEEGLWGAAQELGLLESGDISRMLWQPCPFLEEMIGIVESSLPREDGGIWKAIDIACGSGRDCVFLAKRGWDVTGIDHSADLLNKLHESAARENCSVKTCNVDLEPAQREPNSNSELQDQLLMGSDGYDLVHVARYLHRSIFPILKNIISPGGFIIYHTFMEPSMGKPKNLRFLLKDKELLQHFHGFEVIKFEQGKLPDGRPAQFLCARKPK